MLKVSGGVYKNTILGSPPAVAVRPTPAVVRVATLNIWRTRLQTQRSPLVWDVCAGTGIMGIELASAGAHEVVLVDHHESSLKLIRENVSRIRNCTLPAKMSPCEFTVLAGDAFALHRIHQPPPQLMFVDPPFAQSLAWLEYWLDQAQYEAGFSQREAPIWLLLKLATADLEAACTITAPVRAAVKTYRYGAVALLSYRMKAA